MALVLYTAQNYHVGPPLYYLERDLAGAPIVCTPWFAETVDDPDECMKEQRAIDVAWAVNTPLF